MVAGIQTWAVGSDSRVRRLFRNPSLSAEGKLTATVLIAAVFALQFAGGEAQQLLRYERDSVLNGQVWRLLTAHLVHLGWSHLLLNTAGLIFLLSGFGPSPRHLSVKLFVIALAVSSALLIFEPALDWYVGLSGLLHGLAVLLAFQLWTADRFIAMALCGGVAAKVFWEQVAGSDADLALQIGGEVIVDAHLYGLLAGVACALAAKILERMRDRVLPADNAGERL
jgi:rhomboid family GlyGly-CTERM serine protease